MSKPINPRLHQIECCAAYIPDSKTRAQFVSLLLRANELHTQATALRREAWSLYRVASNDGSNYA